MAHQRRGQLVALVALLALAVSSGIAQSSGGILYPNDGVTLDGRIAVVSSALMQGSRIHTGVRPTVMTASGSLVQIFPNTTLSFSTVMDLSCGGLVVATSRGLAVRAAGVTVTGAAENTRFEILNGSGRVQVTLHSGAAQISDASGTTMLQPNQSQARSGSADCPAVTPLDSPAPPTSVASGSNMKKYLIGGAIAGGGAAAAVIATRPVSPSRP